MVIAYWHWTVGAGALGALTVLYPLAFGRRLGVSSMWACVTNWRRERAVEALDGALDDAALEAALAEAAAELEALLPDLAFAAPAGPGSAAAHAASADLFVPSVHVAPDNPVPASAHSTPTDATAETVSTAEPGEALPPRPPLVSQAVFLTALFVGGVVAAVVSGRFELRGDLGPAYRSIVTGGPLLWPTVFGGGVLVGFGTRLAGGCSSGHGLSGCSRLRAESVIATACFFAAGSAVSFLLWKVW